MSRSGPLLPVQLSVAAAFLLGSGALGAAPPVAASFLPQARLIALEDARFRAQVDRDLAELDRAIAPEAIYIHANGIIQSKAEYLHDVEAGASRYRSIEASERSVTILGDMAITHALVRLEVGVDRRIVARTTGVYVRRQANWLVLSWQSTPVTASSAAPAAPAPAPGTK